MALYNFFYNILFGIKDIKDGTNIYRNYRELLKQQYYSVSEIRNIQNQKLKKLVANAFENSPYYRKRLSDLSSTIGEGINIDNIHKLPVLSRADLQENYQDILCENVTTCYKDSSGGSTGAPVIFYHDDVYAAMSRSLNMLFFDWLGLSPGDKTAVIWGADRDLKDASRYDKIMNFLNRVIQINSFSMTEDSITAFIKKLNDFRPKYIYGYSSSLYLTAKYVNTAASLQFTPRAIRSSAEMLYDYQRLEIEKAFRAPVFDFYGSREVNNIAAECSAHEGLHVFEPARLVEIVDDAGQPVPDGEVGYVAVTDLVNHTFPFIRYLNGDMAEMRRDSCSCGRGLRILNKIYGRSSDTIKVDGLFIHGEYFTHIFYNQPNIKQFQFIQESPMDYKLVLVGTPSPDEIERFKDTIRNKIGDDKRIEVVLVDEIPSSPSGKHRFTISKIT